MPRRRIPGDARNTQICVAVKATDARMLRAESQKLGISLSRWAYCRMMSRTSQPRQNRDCMMLAGAVGRIGVLLNQIARVAHADGFNTERFQQALALTQEVQRLLWSVQC